MTTPAAPQASPGEVNAADTAAADALTPGAAAAVTSGDAPGEEQGTSARTAHLGADFWRLWAAYSTSALGGAIGSGALALIAVLTLHAPAWQVSVLAALGCAASATLALPLGPAIEHRRKRPVMVASDLVRAAALASVPIAAWAGVLTFAQLCVVSVISALGMIAFASASGAHLKVLVAPEARQRANSRFESTTWTTNVIGGSLGGVVVTMLGAGAAMALDAVSFVASAAWVRSIRSPEPPPPVPEVSTETRRRRWAAGWRVIAHHDGLRPLFLNALLFSGGMLMVSPLETVYVLRDRHFTPWQYGLITGVACLGGLVGALFAPRALDRLGERRLLLAAGMTRTLWIAPLLFVPTGAWGVVLVLVIDAGLLTCAGVFNPTYATFRMRETPDDSMARVQAAWSISMRLIQTATVLLGGVLAAAVGVRTSIAVAASICLASCVFLPWRRGDARMHSAPS